MALTAEQIKAINNQANAAMSKLAGGNSTKIEKPQVGVNRYRILPHWDTKDAMTFEAYRVYARHWVKNFDKEKPLKAVTLCERTTYQRHCPVCDEYFTHFQDDSLPKDVLNKIKEANAGTRILVNALNLNGMTPDKPVVLELPYGVFTAIWGDPKKGSKGLVQQYLNLRSEMIFDLENGSDIFISREGTGLRTEYTVQLPDDMTTNKPVNPAILDHLHDLDKLVDSFRHTAQDEAVAIKTIRELANGGAKPSGAAVASAVQAAVAEPVIDDDVPFENRSVAKTAEPVSAQQSAALDPDDILADLELEVS